MIDKVVKKSRSFTKEILSGLDDSHSAALVDEYTIAIYHRTNLFTLDFFTDSLIIFRCAFFFLDDNSDFERLRIINELNNFHILPRFIEDSFKIEADWSYIVNDGVHIQSLESALYSFGTLLEAIFEKYDGKFSRIVVKDDGVVLTPRLAIVNNVHLLFR